MLDYVIPIKVKLHLQNNPCGKFKTIGLHVDPVEFLFVKL